MELGYENAPVQQCPKAGVGPEDWSEGKEKDKEVEIKEEKFGSRQWRKGTDIKELQAKQQR